MKTAIDHADVGKEGQHTNQKSEAGSTVKAMVGLPRARKAGDRVTP